MTNFWGGGERFGAETRTKAQALKNTPRGAGFFEEQRLEKAGQEVPLVDIELTVRETLYMSGVEV
ncbi:MAG: hypothetical protein IPG76_24745 [Acidobacteria bacterium]|nr:hypothetical protein [Acidobacteriota bacterium]